MLLENVTTKITYSGTRLSSKFTKIKDITVKKHQCNIVHYVKYPESKCSENYTGETARRLSERVPDHTVRDAKSHLVKHAIEKCYKYPKIGYKNNTLKRRFTESLFIKDVRPFLNTHEKLVQLKLCN